MRNTQTIDASPEGLQHFLNSLLTAPAGSTINVGLASGDTEMSTMWIVISLEAGQRVGLTIETATQLVAASHTALADNRGHYTDGILHGLIQGLGWAIERVQRVNHPPASSSARH